MSGRPRQDAARSRRRAGALDIVRGMVLAAILLLVGLGGFVLLGVYDVSALHQHTPLVYRAIDAVLRRSIEYRARGIEPPPLDRPAMIERGFRHYRDACVQCHGAPGVAREDIGKGMTPVPANMVDTARRWRPAEIYWTVRNGIKMTGMPAWEFVYEDEDIWAIVAFVEAMPGMTAADYRAMDARVAALDRAGIADAASEYLPTPDPERGRTALQGHGCTACHSIPGVVGPEPEVGPPLQGIAGRRYIAGVLSNDFDNMVRWIRDPQAVDPRTVMPDLDVGERDAADIAAYLYAMDDDE